MRLLGRVSFRYYADIQSIMIRDSGWWDEHLNEIDMVIVRCWCREIILTASHIPVESSWKSSTKLLENMRLTHWINQVPCRPMRLQGRNKRIQHACNPT